MNRYKKANEGIHAPEELKQSVVRRTRPSYTKWVSAVAAVLVIAIVAGVALWPGNTPVAHAAAGVIAEAVYPVSAPVPNIADFTENGVQDWKAYNEAADLWSKADRERRNAAPGRDVTDDFCAAVLPQLLGNSRGENRVCSPLNLYMALAMLAEVTDGNSREQVLNLLGANSLKEARDTANRLFTSSYREDGDTTLRPAASLWLREDTTYVQETMDVLAEQYYASSYSGKMGSEEYNKALQDWLNQQTGGLLEDYASELSFDPETVLALATSLYFRCGWQSEFLEENNTQEVFHGAGRNKRVTFLNSTTIDRFYWGDQFTAFQKRFNCGQMWFLLPDEGVSVDELLENGTAADFFSAQWEWENNGMYTVNFSLPKFDISSDIDLCEELKALGITDVFDCSTADFTPMTDIEEVYVGKATHAARVSVDETGVEAAAYTVIWGYGAGIPTAEKEVDFVLDRPFLFAVTSDTGHLLFVGAVNQL